MPRVKEMWSPSYFAGPYMEDEILLANRAGGGKAVVLYLGLHRRCKMDMVDVVAATPSLYRSLGITRDSGRRALRSLVECGLVTVVESAGRNRAPRVRLPRMVRNWKEFYAD